jgi:hypothetical protein
VSPIEYIELNRARGTRRAADIRDISYYRKRQLDRGGQTQKDERFSTSRRVTPVRLPTILLSSREVAFGRMLNRKSLL